MSESGICVRLGHVSAIQVRTWANAAARAHRRRRQALRTLDRRAHTRVHPRQAIGTRPLAQAVAERLHAIRRSSTICASPAPVVAGLAMLHHIPRLTASPRMRYILNTPRNGPSPARRILHVSAPHDERGQENFDSREVDLM